MTSRRDNGPRGMKAPAVGAMTGQNIGVFRAASHGVSSRRRRIGERCCSVTRTGLPRPAPALSALPRTDSHPGLMHRLRVILGYLGALLIILSSAAHSFLGWSSLGASLANIQAPPELIGGLRIGWQFGGVAMLTFGCIVIGEMTTLRHRRSAALWSVLLIGLVYAAFGSWAFVVSDFSPFFAGVF